MSTIELKDKTSIQDVGLVRFSDNGLGIYYYLRLPNAKNIVHERPQFLNFNKIKQLKGELSHE